MENFNNLGLPQSLMQSLERMQFKVPTPVQAQAIPPALEGKDIMGSAQTGTGKTAAFGIPLITKLLNNPRGSALVMTPTRELALQVMQTLQDLLGRQAHIGTALLIGGESMPKQIQQLRSRPRLIVGTPGRINDHLERGLLNLHDTGFLVLDELDRMLDIGFLSQIERIMKFLPPVRQTLLFSATLPKNIIAIAEKYQRQPVRVSIGAHSTPVATVTQEVLHVTETNKYSQLIAQLQKREGSIIIFVKTKRSAEKMSRKLCAERYSANAIHGDLRQSQRERVIAEFRDQKHRIMVATDIAARGLDIPHIAHVINYDLPQAAEDYIHRIGRTARAGAEGSAVSLITSLDAGKWREIERMLNPGAASTHEQRGPGSFKPGTSKHRRRRPHGRKPHMAPVAARTGGAEMRQ